MASVYTILTSTTLESNMSLRRLCGSAGRRTPHRRHAPPRRAPRRWGQEDDAGRGEDGGEDRSTNNAPQAHVLAGMDRTRDGERPRARDCQVVWTAVDLMSPGGARLGREACARATARLQHRRCPR